MNLHLFADVAKQLMDNVSKITTPNGEVPIERTSGLGLKIATFIDDGKKITAIQQNPNTASEWATKAQAGHKVVQFKEGTEWLAVSVDGKVHPYGGRSTSPGPKAA